MVTNRTQGVDRARRPAFYSEKYALPASVPGPGDEWRALEDHAAVVGKTLRMDFYPENGASTGFMALRFRATVLDTSEGPEELERLTELGMGILGWRRSGAAIRQQVGASRWS